ncbi:MAG TPA: ABC transporter ATP-binding protein [Gammaproteobacteria bacterium]|nr:ABC transporter ATP-binding protein [Gammaproteobacteria bacterium]
MSDFPVISLQNAGVAYSYRSGFMKKSSYWALKDINCDLHHGETLGVIGRNGAGKTSLLRLMTGIINPSRGKVTRQTNRVAMLSLQVGFLPNLTGRDNAILSALLLGLSKKEATEKMDKIIDFSELEEFIDQPLRSYSTGMRARLGFAVAMQADPDVLLIDEILGVGDRDFKLKSSQALKERIKSDKTVVLVSHQPETIRSLCDRALWIENRESRLLGPVDEVLAAYRTSGRQ